MNERFNVGVAAALVLGGVAALVLAAALAIGGYGRNNGVKSRSSAAVAPLASPAASAPPEAEVEYLPEIAEPAPSAERHP
jgi:hypothetical protein